MNTDEVWSILKIFDIFPVSMATVAILKIPTSKHNSAYASDHSYKVSSSLHNFYVFDLFCIVSMVTADIFEIPTPNSTSTNVAHRY